MPPPRYSPPAPFDRVASISTTTTTSIYTVTEMPTSRARELLVEAVLHWYVVAVKDDGSSLLMRSKGEVKQLPFLQAE